MEFGFYKSIFSQVHELMCLLNRERQGNRWGDGNWIFIESPEFSILKWNTQLSDLLWAQRKVLVADRNHTEVTSSTFHFKHCQNVVPFLPILTFNDWILYASKNNLTWMWSIRLVFPLDSLQIQPLYQINQSSTPNPEKINQSSTPNPENVLFILFI